MDLRPEQLRTFSAVIGEGTLEAAARALHVTPSAVSQRVKALEAATGRVLLRRTKPAAATESGQVILRLAHQMALLESEAVSALDGDPDTGERATIPIAVNADSLDTWALAPLTRAAAAGALCLDVRRDDQDHSTQLLRDGTVMAAITSVAEPVQGCAVRSLGRMRYRPMASPDFAATWFGDGVTAGSLERAPVVVFDRKDRLQDRYLRRRTRRVPSPPRHFVPASGAYARAIVLGLGWGMLPDAQSAADEAAGRLVDLDPGGHIDIPLHWQQWKLRSSALDALADAVAETAARELG